MTLEEAIKHFGSQAALAEAIGKTSAAISMWKARGGVIPIDRQYQIQVASKGRLKADAQSTTPAA
jgi:hypothetical protein